MFWSLPAADLAADRPLDIEAVRNEALRLWPKPRRSSSTPVEGGDYLARDLPARVVAALEQGPGAVHGRRAHGTSPQLERRVPISVCSTRTRRPQPRPLEAGDLPQGDGTLRASARPHPVVSTGAPAHPRRPSSSRTARYCRAFLARPSRCGSPAGAPGRSPDDDDYSGRPASVAWPSADSLVPTAGIRFRSVASGQVRRDRVAHRPGRDAEAGRDTA